MDGTLIAMTLVGAGVAGAYVAIIAVQRWAGSHAADSTLHPQRSDVMWKQVCDERSGAIQGQIEDLKKVTQSGFAEIKDLMRQSQKP